MKYLILFLMLMLPLNASVDLNGTTQYVDFAGADAKFDFTPVTNDMSVSLWFLIESTPGSANDAVINFNIGQGGGNKIYFYFVNSGGTLTLIISTLDSGFSDTGSVYVSWTPTTNQWYHLIYVADDATNSELWIDGVQQTELYATWTDTTAINADDIEIGANGIAGSDPFHVSHLAVFNGYALTPADIATIRFNPQWAVGHASCTAYWPILENNTGSTETLIDMSVASGETAATGTINAGNFSNHPPNPSNLP